jgi:hemerythrin
MEQSLFMPWDESIKLNIPILDEELRALYSLVNSLHYFIEQGFFTLTNKEDFINDPFVKLYEQFMDLHFLTEEKLMESTSYPDMANHVKEHREIKKEYEGISQRIIESGKINEVVEGMNYLKKWWINHIKGDDFKFALHFRRQIKPTHIYIVWTKKYEFGIPIIDEQHRGFSALINTLHYFIQEGWIDQLMTRVDKVHPFEVAVREYMKVHFKTEEGIMAASGYGDLSMHIDEHKKISENVRKSSILSRKSNDAKEGMNFLKSWWLTHINKEDRKFAEYYMVWKSV